MFYKAINFGAIGTRQLHNALAAGYGGVLFRKGVL